MKTRALAAFGVVLGVVAGCAAVIDLGDEATLRKTTIDAGPISEAGTDTGTASDAGPDAAPVYACGLMDSPNTACAACIEQSCCDISKTCAQDPTCVAGLQCVKDCLVQVDCIANCETKYPSVVNETNCSAVKCQQCTPGPKCSRLGECVYNLPDASLLRQVEEGRILELNEDECESAREQVGDQSDAAACSGH